MSRVNKYLYGWKFYCDYGQGWEYETFEETWKGMKENKRLYLENSPYPLKVSKGRMLNPTWEKMQGLELSQPR
jgi:hypothetical protein